MDIEELIPCVKELSTINDDYKKTLFKYLKNKNIAKVPTKKQLSKTYHALLESGVIEQNEYLESMISPKLHFSSGVMVLTVVMKPDRFSCSFNCFYCPNEQPNQPRSYLSSEPLMKQAQELDFDTIKQFYHRGKIMYEHERKLDKLEVILVGGSFTSYSHDYQEEFVTDIYYAANTFHSMIRNEQIREKFDLKTEQECNETAECRIISMTPETNPILVTPEEIIRWRRFGFTKCQLGVQHTNTDILKKVNRHCYYDSVVKAIRLLKDSAMKVDIHLMPNLPSATPELDIEMFDQIINDPDLQADQWKIYPCTVMPFSTIKDWYEAGTYIPYSEDELKRVIKHALVNVPPYIRVNRVTRDFPLSSILAGISKTELRDIVMREMEEEGLQCNEIRAREVKDKEFNRDDVELVVRKYFASDGLEYFISHESKDRKTLYSLLRLRINSINNECVFKELNNVFLLRELHIFGKMLCHNTKSVSSDTQHNGLGKELIRRAEEITMECGYDKIVVISGVGVKGYYKNLGFVETVGGYLIKTLKSQNSF